MTDSGTTSAPETRRLLPALTHAAGSDVGLRRDENQDSYGVITHDKFHVYVVCDGMGGVKGGAIASQLAIEVVTNQLKSADLTFNPELLCSVVKAANRAIFERGAADPALLGMGTTLVAIAAVDDDLWYAHVGDSRAYLVRNRVGYQLTDDHTLVRELVRSGAITPDQAEHHPVSHMLTRSLGPVEDVDVECHRFEHGPVAGDAFVLCSDGLYNLVSAEEIAARVSDCSSEEACSQLIALANSRGGTDNITVMITRVSADYPRDAGSVSTPPLVPEIVPPVADETPAIPEHEADEPRVIRADSFGNLRRPDQPRVTSGVNPESSGAYSLGDQAMQQSSHALRLGLVVVMSIVVGMLWRSPWEATRETIANPVPTRLVSSVELTTPEAATKSEAVHDDSSVVRMPNRDSVERRLKSVELNLRALEQKLTMLDGPLGNQVVEGLRANTARVGELELRIEESRRLIDQETRKLAIWVGRRKRLDLTSAVDMAAEVAVGSAEVRARREAFEQSSWAYLKEVEVWRYDPTNEEVSKKVAVLAKERNDRMEQLGQTLRATIDGEVEAINQRLAELTVERDDRALARERAKADVAFAKVLLSGSDADRQKLKAELLADKKVAESEAKELRRMVQG